MIEVKRVTHEFSVAAQPSKEDIAQLAQQGYRTLINNRNPGESRDQLSPDQERLEAQQQGLTYVHIPITGNNLSKRDVEAFQRAIAESPKPVLAHCQGGKRSFLLWAAGEALSGRDEPQHLIARGAELGYDLQTLPDHLKTLR